MVAYAAKSEFFTRVRFRTSIERAGQITETTFVMNCLDLIDDLGFECQTVGKNTLRLWSPFTYGNDGENIGVFVEAFGNGFRVTDNAEALFHASAMGINISKKRLEMLRRIAGTSVDITDGGEIIAQTAGKDVRQAIASVLNAAMSVSHMEFSWVPRSHSVQFNEEVGKVLLDTLGEKRVARKVLVTGASGHQIEIPFVVDGLRKTYIQPVSYGDERVDWDNVYRGLGKMIDLKNVGADDASRIIIIEDEHDDEPSKAITLLSITANVVPFSKISPWISKLAA